MSRDYASTPRSGTLISQIHQVCGRVWNSLLRKNELEDMSGARGRVLFALWTKDCVPVKVLSDVTSLDKSTLTGIIDRLERDGYIVRKNDSLDRRNVLICRTGKDNLFAKKIPEVSNEMNQLFYKGLSKKEICILDNLLEKILANCKEAECLYK